MRSAGGTLQGVFFPAAGGGNCLLAVKGDGYDALLLTAALQVA